MGTRGRQLLGENADQVINLLNKAFADEWLAYYQYWIGAKVIKGPMKDAVTAELLQHATDELRHATMVSDRIIQLGGTPLLEPKLWYEYTNCGYESPADPFVLKILEQNIAGEQCAISVYESIMKQTRDIDQITHEIALQIITDEVEHEEDLQSLQEDLELMLQRGR